MARTMTIRSYTFGSITIGERTFSSDVIIYPDRVESSWRRAEGHVLAIGDLEGPFAARPEVIVVGTGYFGVMKVPEATKSQVAARRIELVIERTAKAVEIYHALQKSGKAVVAALHLTC